MIWYFIVEKSDNVVIAVETAEPADGVYDSELYKIMAIPGGAHPDYAFDVNGEPVSCPPADAVEVEKYKTLEDRIKTLEVNLESKQ